METKPKTYKQEFLPLWREGIKSWFGWGYWGQTVTSLVFTVVPIFLFLYFNQIEIAIENAEQLFFAILIGTIWFCIVAVICYISANIKLFNNQVDKRRELGEFIENPFDTIGREPYMKNTGKPRWASINIINKTSLVVNKCYVEMIKVTDSNGRLVVPIPNTFAKNELKK